MSIYTAGAMAKLCDVSVRGYLDKAIIPTNIILGIEDIMEKKNKAGNKKKLTVIYIIVGVVAASQLLLLIWLIMSRFWRALAVYLFTLLVWSIDNSFSTQRCHVYLSKM